MTILKSFTTGYINIHVNHNFEMNSIKKGTFQFKSHLDPI